MCRVFCYIPWGSLFNHKARTLLYAFDQDWFNICDNDGVIPFSDAASLVTRGTKNVKHFQTMCRVLCYIPSG